MFDEAQNAQQRITDRESVLLYPGWGITEHWFKSITTRMIGLNSAAMDTSIDDTNETWTWTLAILAGLILFGFVIGYTTRGPASADAKRFTPGGIDLSTRALNWDVETLGSQDVNVSAFGTDRADEVLAYQHNPDGSAHAIVQLHAASANESDALSFLTVSPDGKVSEWLHKAGTGALGSHVALTSAGTAFVASHSNKGLDIARFDHNGQMVWNRALESVEVDALASMQLMARGDQLKLFVPTPDAEGHDLIVFGATGEQAWQQRLETKSDAIAVQGLAGEVMVLTSTSGLSDPNLIALTPTGDIAWQTPVALTPNETVVAGLVSATGGALLLIDGVEPALLEIDVTGTFKGVTPLESLSGLSPLSLELAPDGEILVTARNADRTLYFERQSAPGIPTGMAELALPEGTDLFRVATPQSGQIQLIGSGRDSLYSDADIFQISLPIDAYETRSIASVAPLSVGSGSEAFFGLLNASMAQVAEPIAATPVAATIMQTEPKTPEIIFSDIVFRNATSIENNEQDTQLVSASETENVTTVTAQCRFACQTRDRSASFPIWQEISAADRVLLSEQVSDAHAKACSIAEGIPQRSVSAECTIY